MSALHPKADIAGRRWDVRYVPEADIVMRFIRPLRRRGRAGSVVRLGPSALAVFRLMTSSYLVGVWGSVA
jgi:hypothetical protein